MGLIYKKATLEDIEVLTTTRVEVLREANKLPRDADMSEVEKQSYIYYQKALENGTHIAYLVFDENHFAGAGGVNFYQVMPTYHNPSGNRTYIMNMYTVPQYRRRGVAYKTLDLLVKITRMILYTKKSCLERRYTPPPNSSFSSFCYVSQQIKPELR